MHSTVDRIIMKGLMALLILVTAAQFLLGRGPGYSDIDAPSQRTANESPSLVCRKNG